MKTILLKFEDDRLFYLLNEDKAKNEKVLKNSLTWEAYFILLAGFNKKRK